MKDVKIIEVISDEDLLELWSVIGGTPHLFEDGKEDLKKGLINGDFEGSGIQLDFHTMVAIVDTLRERGFALPSQNTKPDVGVGGKEKTVRQIAAIVWKGAANAYRLYPDNKHTFVGYWDAAKSQFDEFIQSLPSPDPAPPVESEAFIQKHLDNVWENLKEARIQNTIGKMYGGLESASIEHFLKTGRINGSFLQRLNELCDSFKKWDSKSDK